MPRQAGNTKAPARRAGAAKSGKQKKRVQLQKQTPRKRSAAKQEDTAARYFELTGIIMIALALLFGVCHIRRMADMWARRSAMCSSVYLAMLQ